MPIKIKGSTSGSTMLSAPDDGGTEVAIELPGKASVLRGNIDSNVTYQIGATGDYSTINEALEEISKYQPDYDNAGITVTLNLQAGFVMAEQVLVKGIDLGWITITGTDAETSITHTALTIDFSTDDYGVEAYPAFGVSKGGTLPRIGQLFRMSSGTTPEDGKHGVMAIGPGSSAEVLSGAGVQDAGTHGLMAYLGAIIDARSTIFTGAGITGVYAIRNSQINAYGVNASGAGDYGCFANNSSFINIDASDVSVAGIDCIRAERSCMINADGANASGAGSNGVYAANCSTINSTGVDASGAGDYGILASQSSNISAVGANAIGATSIGIYARRASIIDAAAADASGAGEYGIYASNGSTINASNTTITVAGTYGYGVAGIGIIERTGGSTITNATSQTLDTWTSNGYIS